MQQAPPASSTSDSLAETWSPCCRWILGNPSPANARYPYLTDDAATAKNVSCRTAPGNPQCTSYVSNDTLLFPLPSEIGFTEAQYNPVSMSESQMVEVRTLLPHRAWMG